MLYIYRYEKHDMMSQTQILDRHRMIKMMMLDNIVSIFRHLSWSSACAFLLVPSRLTRTIKPLILSPFRAHLAYLLFLSFLGYLVLVSTNLRLAPPNARLPGLEAAFMSISAVTSSSMSTVEMELFSNAQLLVLTLLMFLGGEVFTSMLALYLETRQETSASSMTTLPDTNPSSLAELGFNKSNDVDDYAHTSPDSKLTAVSSFEKLTVVKALAYLVLAYILVIHFCGSLLVYLYMITAPTAAHVLKSKSILPSTFALFLTSSSFANCGFVPTNENMAVFKTDSVLLLLVVPQILMGNTLYPICIRILIRVMEFATRNSLYTHMLSKSNPAGYSHLLSGPATRWFGWTGVAFVASQVVMLGALEWGSEAFRGMGWIERLAACMFQSVNSRHAGESVVDLAILSPAILVLFILMMYLPPYFTFMPCGDDDASRDPEEEEVRRSIESADRRNKKKQLIRMENFIFSDLSNLAIFVILISITERKSLKSDPLNFNVLNIVLEVVSAYGNVGFSTGYSCKRRVDDNPFCEEKTYGFAGRWSIQGKLVLIAVMIFGKLKKFNRNGGKAWRSY